MQEIEIPAEIEKHLEKFPSHREWLDVLLIPPVAEEAVEQYPELCGSTLLEADHECVAPGVTRLAFYYCLRRQGESHKMAEVIAAQEFHGVMTDDVFWQGMGMLGDNMRPQQLESLIASAKAQGFTPTAHHVYMPQLARFRGDKQAFVSRSDGRSYIRKLLESRGWESDGAVRTSRRDPDSDPLDPKNCTPLADDIIHDTARDMLKKDPSLKRKSRSELRDMIVDKHGFKVKGS